MQPLFYWVDPLKVDLTSVALLTSVHHFSYFRQDLFAPCNCHISCPFFYCVAAAQLLLGAALDICITVVVVVVLLLCIGQSWFGCRARCSVENLLVGDGIIIETAILFRDMLERH